MNSGSRHEPLDPPAGHLADLLALSALALASRFADGATLWCVAPGRSDHALHVAVEFVHPAIVGKPALPAVAVSEPNMTKSLRNFVRSGDAILCVGPGDDTNILDITRRGLAWGAETIWIGWGIRPPNGDGTRPLWLASGQDSEIVRAYHLLWELTHICLEHQVSLSPQTPSPQTSSAEASCQTCADQLAVAEVVSVSGTGASVRTSGGVETVDTSLIEAVVINDLVLTQAGVALQILDNVGTGEAQHE